MHIGTINNAVFPLAQFSRHSLYFIFYQRHKWSISLHPHELHFHCTRKIINRVKEKADEREKWAFYDKDSACDGFMEINCFQFISKHSTELKWLKDLIRLHFFFCLNCERKNSQKICHGDDVSQLNDSSENLFRENCRWVQLSRWFDHKNSSATFQFHFVCLLRQS